MSVYTYNDVEYDIKENTDLIGGIKKTTVIPAKGRIAGKVESDFGYSTVGLYSLDILDGIKRAVEEYQYNSILVLKIKETYIDSDEKKHYIHKLINLGGYVTEKYKKVKVRHISNMFCGKLSSIEWMIINNSNFAISVQNLSLYKSMEYGGDGGSTGGATYIEVRNGLPPEEEIRAGRVFYDLSGGTS